MSSYLCDQYFAVLFDCFSFCRSAVWYLCLRHISYCFVVRLSVHFVRLCRLLIQQIVCVSVPKDFSFNVTCTTYSNDMRYYTFASAQWCCWVGVGFGFFFWRNCFLVLPLMLVFFCVGCEVLITNNIINWISVNGNISNDMLIIEISIREFSQGTSLRYF